MASFFTLVLQCCFICVLIGASSAQLSTSFYASSCPLALIQIRTAVRSAILKDNRMGASLLRLHFHDCFVNGCDGSILLDDTENFKGEKSAGMNINSIRGYEVIDKIKAQVESICPGVVSCADIVALAARDSVVALGGPSWTVKLGRRDSLTASLSAANSNISLPSSSLSELLSSFANQGFSPREMVALSGAHTIGKARCFSFRDRAYNDTDIDLAFKASLQAKCPRGSEGDNNLAPLDQTTPRVFDNAYFRNLMRLKGVLHSDQQLFSGATTDSFVQAYSSNPHLFLSDFSNAMVKMGHLNVLTGSDGEIRTNCRRTN